MLILSTKCFFPAPHDVKADGKLGFTKCGARIQIEMVPFAMLDKIDIFFVCEDCGKVYWDGSHFEKILNGRLQEVVVSN